MMITVMLIMLTMMMIMIVMISLDDGNNINNDHSTQIYFGSILLQA